MTAPARTPVRDTAARVGRIRAARRHDGRDPAPRDAAAAATAEELSMTATRRDLLIAGGIAALGGGALSSIGAAAVPAPGTTATPGPSPSAPTPSAAAPTAAPSPSRAPTAAPTPLPTPVAVPTSFPLRLRSMPARDPFVVADPASGLYHLYVSNVPSFSGVAGVGTMVYRSPDLQHWSAPDVVFRTTPDLWGQEGAWAPEVHRWRGRWYLFTSLFDSKRALPLRRPDVFGLPLQTRQHWRGTAIASSSALLGPFTVLDRDQPVAPHTFMTLDGTLFVDPKGQPWMVYAHEWLQKIDGTIEAVPLKRDLSGASGHPIHLFKGSDATWIAGEMPAPSADQIAPYVTDGPQLYRLPGGGLAMLWSTYEKRIDQPNGTVSGGYVETQAVSPSGRLTGPWVQRPPLLRRNSGHGMVFSTLPSRGHRSRPMLVVHRTAAQSRAKLYEVALQRDGVHLGRQRTDLDGGG